MAKSRKQIIFEDKKFLNKKGQHSDASVYGKIYDDGSNWSGGEFKIRDCHHVVTLQLAWGLHEEQTRENVIFKLKTLEDFVRKMREAVETKTK